jgi:hypothetical protein
MLVTDHIKKLEFMISNPQSLSAGSLIYFDRSDLGFKTVSSVKASIQHNKLTPAYSAVLFVDGTELNYNSPLWSNAVIVTTSNG